MTDDFLGKYATCPFADSVHNCGRTAGHKGPHACCYCGEEFTSPYDSPSTDTKGEE